MRTVEDILHGGIDSLTEEEFFGLCELAMRGENGDRSINMLVQKDRERLVVMKDNWYEYPTYYVKERRGQGVWAVYKKVRRKIGHWVEVLVSDDFKTKEAGERYIETVKDLLPWPEQYQSPLKKT